MVFEQLIQRLDYLEFVVTDERAEVLSLRILRLLVARQVDNTDETNSRK
jgi:hypothetical protein